MITYSKTSWGLHLLLRLYGSAIPRTIPFALLSAGLTALFSYVPWRGYFPDAIQHPYPFQLFYFIVGFSLVFRTNFGYSRYWEGRSQLQSMTAALADLCSRALTYEAVSLAAAAAAAAAAAPAPGAGRAPPPQQQQQQQQQQNGPALAADPEAFRPLSARQRRVSFSDSLRQGPEAGPAQRPTDGASPSQSQLPSKPQDPSQREPQHSQHTDGEGKTVESRGSAAPGASLELVPSGPGEAQAVAVGTAALPAQSSDYVWQAALTEYWRNQYATEEGHAPLAQLPPPPPKPPQQLPVPPLPLALAAKQREPSPSAGPALPPAELRQYIAFKEELLHLASLYHALALQHLRVDWVLDNLTEHNSKSPPPMDGRGLPDYHLPWPDIFVLRGTPEAREAYNRAMKLPVIGPISGWHRHLLRQQSEADPKVVTETFFSGLDQGPAPRSPRTSTDRARNMFRLSFLEHQTGSWIEGGPERVYTAYNWIQLLLARRTREGPGGWRLPAPVTTAVLSQLSHCYASFEQCRKLADTPFPFPWSQAIVVMLLAYSLTNPIMMSAYISQVWLGVLLSFISVMVYWALNEVARDLEDPFIYDPNDLPLARHQHDFNKRILAASETILVSLQQGAV